MQGHAVIWGVLAREDEALLGQDLCITDGNDLKGCVYLRISKAVFHR